MNRFAISLAAILTGGSAEAGDFTQLPDFSVHCETYYGQRAEAAVKPAAMLVYFRSDGGVIERLPVTSGSTRPDLDANGHPNRVVFHHAYIGQNRMLLLVDLGASPMNGSLYVPGVAPSATGFTLTDYRSGQYYDCLFDSEFNAALQSAYDPTTAAPTPAAPSQPAVKPGKSAAQVVGDYCALHRDAPSCRQGSVK